MESLSMEVWQLPVINAVLNTGSAIFLLLAFMFIRRHKVRWHRASIIAALVCSALFLTSYLFYHYLVGHVSYGGTGLMRILYFAILLSHTILAMVALPLIIWTLTLAWRQHPRHPKIGRITLAIWLYVSVTGVIVFLLLQPYAIEHVKQLHANVYTINPILDTGDT